MSKEKHIITEYYQGDTISLRLRWADSGAVFDLSNHTGEVILIPHNGEPSQRFPAVLSDNSDYNISAEIPASSTQDLESGTYEVKIRTTSPTNVVDTIPDKGHYRIRILPI